MNVSDYEANKAMNDEENAKIKAGAAGRLRDSIIDLVTNYVTRRGVEDLREAEVKARLLAEIEYSE